VRELLEGVRVLHLRVQARSAAAVGAPFTGSVLRGALGAAFFPAGAAPFALAPPPRIERGPFAFDLKLFGLAEAASDGVFRALAGMGRSPGGSGPGRFAVERIESLGPDGAPAATHLDGLGSPLGHDAFYFEAARAFDGARGLLGSSGSEPARVRLALRTPLRMKEAGRVRSGLSPVRLVSAALRRLSILGRACGQAWPRGFSASIEAARAIAVERDDARWFDWGRFSVHQGRAMRLGGMVGDIEYRGVPSVLLSLLGAAAFCQLGKNTAFGLGVADVVEVG